MAATSADIRSILQLGPPVAAVTQPKKERVLRKPEGVSREVYALIGDSAPSISVAKPRLKHKPNLGGSSKVKWQWKPFQNPGRMDSLTLGHWVKVTAEPEPEYPFAKYNVQAPVYIYSQDEYTKLLEDPEWTKEETDYLFEVVREYDSRWFVIHDRYEYQNGIPRSLEDLKDRYYAVCRKLVRTRPWAGDELSKTQLMSSFAFDKGREIVRKNYVQSLMNRTPAQVAEEEALYIEIKRLEQNERRFKKEREELLRLLAGADSGLPEVANAMDDEGLVGMAPVDTKKNKKRAGTVTDYDTPTTPSSNIIALGPPVVKRPHPPQTPKSAAYDLLHCISRSEPPATTNKNTHHPAFLRSLKLTAPKTTNAPLVTAALAELGISHARLVMPTRENCLQHDGLMEATAALVETKKVVDKVEQDIRTLGIRLGMRGASDDGEMNADGDAGTPYVDDREGGDPEGSVVSARQRPKKHGRRSVSVSSVDTTVSGRDPKRQKRR